MIRTTQKTLAALLVAIALLCIAPASAFAESTPPNPENGEKAGELNNPAPSNDAPDPTKQNEVDQNKPTFQRRSGKHRRARHYNPAASEGHSPGDEG